MARNWTNFFFLEVVIVVCFVFFVVTRAKCDDGAHRTDAVNP